VDNKHFIKSLRWVETGLSTLNVNRAFNSIGSNIFIECGNDIEVVFPNMKKDVRKEWIIWVSDASWRISKNEQYIVGSGDDPKIIQTILQNLLGKRFQSLHILSQFLDAEFNFEDGYQLTTFFNLREEHQWLLFLPDKTEIVIDCSSKEKIKNVQELANQVTIKESHTKLDLPLQDTVVEAITYDKHDLPTFHCADNISIVLEICTWRLEKNNEYCVGYLDDNADEINTRFSELIGKKLIRIDVANSMMDARFQFQDHYTLKTFACCRSAPQWKICSKGTTIFSATIPLSD
jgi:hypothetical protein